MVGYKFPKITHISQIQNAIQGRDEFYIADRGDYFIANYTVNFSETFPEITDENSALLRECRGIIFDKNGSLIRRPYPKFFNLGEKSEFNHLNMDFSSHHVVLEKLDGSFIAPFKSNGRLIFGTKMGETHITPMVLDFLKPNYVEFTEHWIQNGFTPIFEFCSNKARIVLDYPEDRLVLTGLRYMETGEIIQYKDMVDYANQYEIDVVKACSAHGVISNPELFLEYTKNLKGEEGFVVRFHNGFMVKIKSEQYVLFHRALGKLAQEKDLVETIASNLVDDCYSFLNPDILNSVKEFQKVVLTNATNISKDIFTLTNTNKHLDRKSFAVDVANKTKFSSIMFKLYQMGTFTLEDTLELVLNHIKKSCANASKLEENRHWIGAKWNDFCKQTIRIED